MTNDIMQMDRTTDLGSVRINNEAIVTIASIAAMEVKGVCRMGGGLRRTLGELFFGNGSAGGVRISMRESEIKLAISLIVDYGVDIPRVADEVQDSVKHAVEKMTGLIMAEVDVIIEGVHAPTLFEKEKRKGGSL